MCRVYISANVQHTVQQFILLVCARYNEIITFNKMATVLFVW